MSTVTRRTAVRGSQVRVTLRDGRVLTGRLVGWGAQVLDLALDEATKRSVGSDWKRNAYSTHLVQKVETV